MSLLAAVLAAAAACAAPEHRQFDFWLGDWEVKGPAGKVAGTNRIESIHDGCTLRETWTGASGSNGTSLNAYAEGRWHQTWTDNSGLLLLLDGGLKDGRMVLEGKTAGAKPGETTLHRISWQKLEDGRVRQHWQTSADGAKTWQDAFVGFYSKAGAR